MSFIDRNGKQGGRFHCNDGWNISVIWGDYAYCSPRKDNSLFYLEVEAGFPSTYEGDIIDYAEDQENYTGTVYGYVPVELLLEVFKKHGGVRYFKSQDGPINI